LRRWDRKGGDGPFHGADAPTTTVLELPLSELEPFLTQPAVLRLYRLVCKLLAIQERKPPRPACHGPDVPAVAAAVTVDLSPFVLELPLSELARLLPRHLAARLGDLVRRCLAGPETFPFPCNIDDLKRDRALFSAFRARLARVRTLAELIADPPTIVIDEGQKLFFYRGIPILLRPVSFVYILLLARTPGQFVLRERIYERLWPGEMNYEGSDKPYERQVSDHKRRLIGEIRRGTAGRVEVEEGEMESLIATRHRTGYMLNLTWEHVLILGRTELLAFACLLLWDLERFFMAMFLDTPELIFMW